MSKTSAARVRQTLIRSAGAGAIDKYNSWGCQNLTGAPKCMGSIAGPPIVPGVSNHSSPYRVQFDVAEAGQEISVLLNQAGTKPTLEQSAASGIRIIEVTDVPSAYRLHQSGNSIIDSGCHQQVHMVGHEHPTMHIYLEPQRAFSKPVCISRLISVTGEQSLAVVSPLNDVDRKTNGTISASSGHAPSPSAQHWPHSARLSVFENQQNSTKACQPTLALDSDPITYSGSMPLAKTTGSVASRRKMVPP